MKKAVIFDLDGTLWDSSLEIALSWSSVLNQYGLRLSQADVQSVMGKTSSEIAAIFFPNHTPDAQKEIFEACSAAEMKYLHEHGATLYPYLEQVLEELSRDYSLCLVSNCQEGYIETFFHCTGLGHWFSDTECAGHTGLPKGENIRLVLARNGFESAVYVGDTQKDLDAAAAAGIPFIHAAYGFGTVSASLPAIHTLPELPALVNGLIE